MNNRRLVEILENFGGLIRLLRHAACHAKEKLENLIAREFERKKMVACLSYRRTMQLKLLAICLLEPGKINQC